jgi:hypothetical protein
MPRTGLCLALAAVLLATPVQAAPIDDFMVRLDSYLQAAGGHVAYTTTPGKSKGGIILPSLSLINPAGETISLGTDVFVGAVNTLPGDILHVENAVINNFSRTEQGTTVSIGSLVLLSMLLPPIGTSDPMVLAQTVGGFVASNIAIEDAGETVSIDSVTYGFEAQPQLGTADPTSVIMSLSVRGLLVNQPIMSALDLSASDMGILIDKKVDLSLPLVWDLQTGTLSLTGASVYVPTLGRFSVSATLGGVTDALLGEVLAAGQIASMTGTSEAAAQQQALGLKLLSQLTLVTAGVNVVDEGIAAFAIETTAGNAGTDLTVAREAMIANVQGSLVGLGLPDLSTSAAAAVRGFLENGGTLVVNATPDAPLNLLQIVASAQSPQVLIEQLNVFPLTLPR